ncbi:MAG: thioredoxin family protein [Planctomycetales bacterium]|nr:thioredoxin family protein [Planctomycetales bacterium]
MTCFRIEKDSIVNKPLSNAIWLAVAIACGSVLADDGIRWAPDLPSARQAAAQFNVPILIHFYGDNCLACRNVDERVYSRPELIETLNKYFICVRINATVDRQSAINFQVHSWPSDVFMCSDGNILLHSPCRQELNGYLGVLHNVAVMNRDRNVLIAAEQKARQQAQAGLQHQQLPVQPSAAPGLGSNRVGPNFAMEGATTPGFYNSPTEVPGQQLQASVSPNSAVRGGPVLAANQPQAVSGAANFVPNSQGVPAQQTQFYTAGDSTGLLRQNSTNAIVASGPPANAVPISTPANDLTPSHTAPNSAMLAGTRNEQPIRTGPASQQNRMASYAQVPQVAQPNNATASRSTFGASVTDNSLMVSNPYYAAPNQLPAVQPPATQSLAAQSFQAQSQQGPTLAPNLLMQQNSTAPSSSAAGTPAQQVGFQTTYPESDNSGSQPTQSHPIDESSVAPAMEGFCIIEAKKGNWVAGEPQYAVRHRGQVYWMSSLSAQRQFLADPDRAAPVLSGYDPMVFLTEGRLVPGSIHHTLHERIADQLFLFASEQSKAQYFPPQGEETFARHTQALLRIIKQADGR